MVYLCHQTCSWIFGTTAWGNIRLKRLRRPRGELFTLFVQWRRLHQWRCSKLSSHLFSDNRNKFFLDFSTNLLSPPHYTKIKSRPRRATTYPRQRNRTNWSRTARIQMGLIFPPYQSPRLIVNFFHCMAFHFISCLVLYCCTTVYLSTWLLGRVSPTPVKSPVYWTAVISNCQLNRTNKS